MDDLDAICYAHDYCYYLTSANDFDCDMAFMDLMIEYETEFKGPGCWNLASDMSNAFFVKYRGAFLTTVGASMVAILAVLKAPLIPFLKSPEEGTCNVGSESDPLAMIGEYQRQYEKQASKDGSKTVQIPTGKEDYGMAPALID